MDKPADLINAPLRTPELIAIDTQSALSVRPAWLHDLHLEYPEGYEEDAEHHTPAVTIVLGRKRVTSKGLAIRDEAIRRGTRPADIDAHLVDTIILNAERIGDEGLLSILDETLPGQEHPMSYGLDVQKKRDASAERITKSCPHGRSSRPCRQGHSRTADSRWNKRQSLRPGCSA